VDAVLARGHGGHDHGPAVLWRRYVDRPARMAETGAARSEWMRIAGWWRKRVCRVAQELKTGRCRFSSAGWNAWVRVGGNDTVVFSLVRGVLTSIYRERPQAHRNQRKLAFRPMRSPPDYGRTREGIYHAKANIARWLATCSPRVRSTLPRMAGGARRPVAGVLEQMTCAAPAPRRLAPVSLFPHPARPALHTLCPHRSRAPRGQSACRRP